MNELLPNGFAVGTWRKESEYRGCQLVSNSHKEGDRLITKVEIIKDGRVKFSETHWCDVSESLLTICCQGIDYLQFIIDEVLGCNE